MLSNRKDGSESIFFSSCTMTCDSNGNDTARGLRRHDEGVVIYEHVQDFVARDSSKWVACRGPRSATTQCQAYATYGNLEIEGGENVLVVKEAGFEWSTILRQIEPQDGGSIPPFMSGEQASVSINPREEQNFRSNEAKQSNENSSDSNLGGDTEEMPLEGDGHSAHNVAQRSTSRAQPKPKEKAKHQRRGRNAFWRRK
eukprot:gnl/MRDRNA2_/MRDRNA2_20243_c0_seq1.p1 gnl/MRDRNA2_/MRDRNA2_20243_c0~~gnl/MRDRNA2_/MRDRNA2_20243_c0_seq1.p1  ORF type:complete len:199 (-),score=30.81 gnl/MRDRNA2_/MRDRNA2_20243_c0_seq1:713-1309(-)